MYSYSSSRRKRVTHTNILYGHARVRKLIVTSWFGSNCTSSSSCHFIATHSWSLDRCFSIWPNFREGAFYESARVGVCVYLVSVCRSSNRCCRHHRDSFCSRPAETTTHSGDECERMETLLRRRAWQRQPRTLVKNRKIMWKIMGKFMERITRPPTKRMWEELVTRTDLRRRHEQYRHIEIHIRTWTVSFSLINTII